MPPEQPEDDLSKPSIEAEIKPKMTDLVVEDDRDDESEEEEEEEEDEEPKLKYAPVTKNLLSLYRNGDATSACVVAGDKMIVGTHNGNIHAVSLPLFQTLRVYHAHSASVTAISISPFPSLSTRPDAVVRRMNQAPQSPSKLSSNSTLDSNSPRSSRTPRSYNVPATPSNSIYIGTASIDGNVCVSSLVDPKDVTLRNFARPVQALALSPGYKSDRSYLSGGLAGQLILTVDGRPGTSSTSTTTGGPTATASGWLGAIGLGPNMGKDTVLHSGEGPISTIKWSLSGKYVVWVNEQGIKIMRSALHLDSTESESAWKRFSHIDRPNLSGWEEMASVWKARAEWIDESTLETDDTAITTGPHISGDTTLRTNGFRQRAAPRSSVEKLVVGWGGTIWIIKVHHGSSSNGNDLGEHVVGGAEILTILRTDCIISGVSLYSQNLLVVLAYVAPDDDDDDDDDNNKKKATPRSTSRGRRYRENALQPELRLIDIETKEEVSVDTLTVSRYEGLSASDYHLEILPEMRRQAVPIVHRGALGAFGEGLWDVTMSPARLLSSAASIRSSRSEEKENGSSSRINSSDPSRRNTFVSPITTPDTTAPFMFEKGTKIFIHSPYDCVIAKKRDLCDHLAWLDGHERYEEAWKLIDDHPEAVAVTSDNLSGNSSITASKAQSSLADFFADGPSQTTGTMHDSNSAAEKEKRRIGDLWIEQLVRINDWDQAGEVCGRVLGTSSRWEHWVWIFARNNRIEEITPYIPTSQLHPPLPSLVYEVILGHYVKKNRIRLKELLEQWSTDLFDISAVISAIEAQLKSSCINKDKESDWRVLLECLAKLYLGDGRYQDALRCYIRLQDADTAMDLIRDHHLIGDISDDIPGLILLRVSDEQLNAAPRIELENATSECISLLVDEAHHGLVCPDTVVKQLQDADMPLFLFFYLRGLWEGPNGYIQPEDFRHPSARSERLASESRSLIEPFSDIAVTLFAEYDRSLLLQFLQASQYYTFDHASAVCEQRNYIPELVYLLSKIGQTKRALRLIIDKLQNVSQAIAFCKAQNDPELWDDLMNESMDKPRFIRGLLEEVGTAIDPVKLVRRIPEGLEIEGLREGLSRMLREYEIQDSISIGVGKVLQSEVSAGMNKLRRGRRKGIKFEIIPEDDGRVEKESANFSKSDDDSDDEKQFFRPGYCPGCRKPLTCQDSSYSDGSHTIGQTLVGFACSSNHVFHLSCLLSFQKEESDAETDPMLDLAPSLDEGGNYYFTRSVGAKVTHARLLRDKIGKGCPLCVSKGQGT